MIDYILKSTGREKLFYLAHSQGSTVFFVMTSELPKYQEKIQAMFAMAPVAYCSRMISPVFRLLAKFSNSLYVRKLDSDGILSLSFLSRLLFFLLYRFVAAYSTINRLLQIRAYWRGHEEISGLSMREGRYHATIVLERVIPNLRIQCRSIEQGTILLSLVIIFFSKDRNINGILLKIKSWIVIPPSHVDFFIANLVPHTCTVLSKLILLILRIK